jgi:hypothetical protein
MTYQVAEKWLGGLCAKSGTLAPVAKKCGTIDAPSKRRSPSAPSSVTARACKQTPSEPPHSASIYPKLPTNRRFRSFRQLREARIEYHHPFPNSRQSRSFKVLTFAKQNAEASRNTNPSFHLPPIETPRSRFAEIGREGLIRIQQEWNPNRSERLFKRVAGEQLIDMSPVEFG